MASDLNDEDFRAELMELFILEAEEWLRQTQMALADLRQRPGPPDPALLESIERGMGNLAGSAATVELPKEEGLAHDVLAALKAIRRAGGTPQTEHWAFLEERVAAVAAAISRLATVTLAGGDGELLEAAEERPEPQIEASTSPEHITIEALRRVHEGLAQSGRASRNFVAVVIERARDGTEPDGNLLHKGSIMKVLRELEGLDEQLLTEAQRRVPEITQAVTQLKTLGEGATNLSAWLEPVIQSVQELHDSAAQARAAGSAQFFQGLATFLSIVAAKGVGVVLRRLDAVELRLGAVVSMVQHWVEAGRVEREAISAALTA